MVKQINHKNECKNIIHIDPIIQYCVYKIQNLIPLINEVILVKKRIICGFRFNYANRKIQRMVSIIYPNLKLLNWISEKILPNTNEGILSETEMWS